MTGIPKWQATPCARCGSKHPTYCDLCASSPACHDHTCRWPDDADEVQS